MPRVLYYGSSSQIHSGACQWMYRLAHNMREHGFETTAVLPEKDGIASWYQESDIPVEYMWSEPIRRRRSLFGQIVYLAHTFQETIRLWNLIRTKEIDIVHVNEIVYLPGLLAGKLSSARTVCHVRAAFESKWIRKSLSGLAILCSDRIVCVSERTAEVMFTEVGYGREQIDVIHDGLPSPERFEASIDENSFRSSIGVDPDDFLVVCVSKIVHGKGQDRLLDIAPSLPDIEFAIVGGEVDGHEKYAEELKEKASKISNLHLTGFYPDIAEVLHAADVVVHLPRYEDPFPGVVLEAMIAAKPVIGSKAGGIPEQIDEGNTGYLVEKKGGEVALKDCLCQLRDNPSSRRSLGQTAKEKAMENFSPTAYFENISILYNDLQTEASR